jgi:hypothetical protein
MERSYQVAAYYFPNYHYEPRNKDSLGEGWTEWDQVKVARPRFPGHRQPKVPIWGYEDESDPAVMARKIDAAADHGITTFLFDWYWGPDGPSLYRALEQGYLRAPNHDRLTFALMWANHSEIDRPTFDAAISYAIEDYFGHPAYWTIEGRPYFSLFELTTLAKGLGGVDATAEALLALRRRVQEATGRDLHLNAVIWRPGDRPGEPPLDEQRELLRRCQFDSLTSYVWAQHYLHWPQFPTTPYQVLADAAPDIWETIVRDYALPYHPNVTVGWDPSPRTDQDAAFTEGPYPATAVMVDNTPEAFELALRAARAFLDGPHAVQPVVTLYAWNEWAEGGFLEPESDYGMAYLEAVRRVFGRARAR